MGVKDERVSRGPVGYGAGWRIGYSPIVGVFGPQLGGDHLLDGLIGLGDEIHGCAVSDGQHEPK